MLNLVLPMTLYSPGVEIIEIDASQIVPSAGAPVAVFAGNFEKGPIGTYVYVDTVEDLIFYYDKPSDKNYNDWYQVYNFLQYGAGKIAIYRIGGVDDNITVNNQEYTIVQPSNAIVVTTQSLPISSIGGSYVLSGPDVWIDFGDYVAPAYFGVTIGAPN